MTTLAGRRAHLVELLVVAIAIAGAAALGAASSLGAFRFDPLLVPATVAFAALAVVSLARPEVGIAAAFVILPAGQLGLVGSPPWAAGVVWVATLLAIAAVRGLGREGEERPVAVPLALGAVVLSALLALPAAELDDALPILRSLATGLGLFVAVVALVHTAEGLRWALAGVAGAALMVGGFAVHGWLTGAGGGEGFFTATGALVTRVDAGFGNPNQLGGFLVVLAPFALACALVARRLRWLAWLAFAMAAAGVYVSFSRSALLALLVVPAFFLRPRVLVTLLPVGLALLAVSTPDLLRERFSTLSTSGGEVATRMDFWRAGAAIWEESPIVGAGLGGYPEGYSNANVPGKQYLPDTLFEPPPHAHNLVLNTLAEQGLLGLLALLAVLATAAAAALSLRRTEAGWQRAVGAAGLAMLFAFCLHNVFDVTLLEATGSFFWALLGILVAATGIARRGEARA